ncbi:hypothetical protein NMG60_11017596 [Bertholletia excelsa]
MYVINRIPSSIQVRCQSKDTDLGLQTLQTNQQLHWSFHINIFETTLYFCHFYWGANDAFFDVFTHRFSNRHCVVVFAQEYNCTWEAREDGFYVSNGSGNFTKIFDWNKKTG